MIDGALITAVLAFVVAAGTPGPATLAVAGTSMASGRRAGLAMGTGLAIGLAAWGVAVGFGFGALVAQSPIFLTAFKIIGGGYLLYLAWLSGRAALRPGASIEAEVLSATRSFRRGLILNLGNPKAALAWIAALALGAGCAQASWGIVGVCALAGVLIYAAYAMVFSLATMQAGYARFRRWIEGVTAALFAFAGLRLLTWRGAA